MISRRSIYLSIVLAFALSTTATAQTKWKMPNLNPFAKKASSTKKSSNVWKMPKLGLPFTGATKSAGKQNPIQQMNQNTKKFFAKTNQMLNPFAKKGSVANSNKKPKLPTFFAKKEKPKAPLTTNEWLKQPRPY